MNNNNGANSKAKKGYADQLKDRDQLLSPKTKVQNWLVGTSQPASPTLETFNISTIKPNTTTKRIVKKTKIKENNKLPNITKSNNKMDTAHSDEKDVKYFLFIR